MLSLGDDLQCLQSAPRHVVYVLLAIGVTTAPSLHPIPRHARHLFSELSKNPIPCCEERHNHSIINSCHPSNTALQLRLPQSRFLRDKVRILAYRSCPCTASSCTQIRLLPLILSSSSRI